MTSRKEETKIVIISVIATILLVLGFTLSQGNFKNTADNYISSNDINSIEENKVDPNEYEIVQVEEDTQVYKIHAKQEFNSKEIAYITKELIKEYEGMEDGYEIYFFNEKEEALSFSGDIYSIQTRVVPIGNNEIQIQNYNKIETLEESTPQEYEILNMENNNGTTKVELILPDGKEPQEALYKIRFIGNLLRRENSGTYLGTLNIIAYTSDEKDESFEYNGEYKDIIINNLYEDI